MPEKLEVMLEKVLENQNKQNVKFAELEAAIGTLIDRGCTSGEDMVDNLTKEVKKDIEKVRAEAKKDSKDIHKRVDKFKIAAAVLAVVAVVFGLEGYKA